MPREEREVRYTVPVPHELDRRVKQRIQTGGFSTIAEYLRGLMRADVERIDRRLEALLLEGLDSGEGITITPEYWETRRRELNARLTKAKKSTTKK